MNYIVKLLFCGLLFPLSAMASTRTFDPYEVSYKYGSLEIKISYKKVVEKEGKMNVEYHRCGGLTFSIAGKSEPLPEVVVKHLWKVDLNRIVAAAGDNGGAFITIYFDKSKDDSGGESVIRVSLDKDLNLKKVYLTLKNGSGYKSTTYSAEGELIKKAKTEKIEE